MSNVCRVAVCDDAEHFRAVLSLSLELAGGGDVVVVGEAADGREAIELVRRTRPDVLLLDVAMPVLDGIEALPQIRAASPETGVVVLSGFSNPELKARALAAGAVRYLEKGVSPETIVAAVREACRSAAA